MSYDLSGKRMQQPRHLIIMFARKVRVEYESGGQHLPCPLKWLDSFSMRNFTNATAFDDTLPVADGMMEIGQHVPLDRLKDGMEDWFRRKSYLAKDAGLTVVEVHPASMQVLASNAPHS